ncbi:MAG: hypothetical protein M0001_08470, partial [Treponema sp.]|nr:hypothetical protein [Treponema sp.]
MPHDLLIVNIGELATPLGFAPPRGKEAMGRVEVTKSALVLALGGKIAWAGPEAVFRSDPALALRAEGIPVLDAKGGAVVPGFVDSHTHFVFAGFRDEEFLWRAGGLPYMEIHRRGGGIRTSMASTRAATLEDLVAIG